MRKASTSPLARQRGVGRRVAAATALALSIILNAPAVPRPPTRPAPVPADTTLALPLPADASAPVPVRRPPAARLRELRGQRDFQYIEAPAEEENGFWARMKHWFWEQLRRLLGTRGGRLAWDALFYAAIGAALVFAVLKFLQVDLTKAFGRAARALPLAYEAGQENIHELNFTDALAQAETTGNLRLAVRLGYLQLLKLLTDRDFIAWQPDKTNQAYLRELEASRPAARATFGELTRQFEYIWYGELPVPAALYQQVRQDQHQFEQQLGRAGRAASLA